MGEDLMNAKALIEAILFVAEEPVTEEELAEVLELARDDVAATLAELQQDLRDGGRGIVLRAVGGGWRLYTHPDARDHVERFASTERAARLSSAAVETLAVVAYRQPVSRGQVGEIRGVDSDHALRTLERRGLVAEVGRAPGPGQAVLFGTTELFLEKLGVNSLAELPPLADHVPPASVVEVLEQPLRGEEPSSASTR
jgi:segregation and condensation protein B